MYNRSNSYISREKHAHVAMSVSRMITRFLSLCHDVSKCAVTRGMAMMKQKKMCCNYVGICIGTLAKKGG